jgi:hypothetical protein
MVLFHWFSWDQINSSATKYLDFSAWSSVQDETNLRYRHCVCFPRTARAIQIYKISRFPISHSLASRTHGNEVSKGTTRGEELEWWLIWINKRDSVRGIKWLCGFLWRRYCLSCRWEVVRCHTRICIHHRHVHRRHEGISNKV